MRVVAVLLLAVGVFSLPGRDAAGLGRVPATRSGLARAGTIMFGNGFDHGTYLIESDGGHLRRLPGSPGGFLFPRWSPDGKKLAYVDSSVPGSDHLTLLTAGGGKTV